MRNLTSNEIEVVNGGATLAESTQYTIAGSIVKLLNSVFKFVPFFGKSINDWLNKEVELSDKSKISNGQKIIGGFLGGLFTPPAVPPAEKA